MVSKYLKSCQLSTFLISIYDTKYHFFHKNILRKTIQKFSWLSGWKGACNI